MKFVKEIIIVAILLTGSLCFGQSVQKKINAEDYNAVRAIPMEVGSGMAGAVTGHEEDTGMAILLNWVPGFGLGSKYQNDEFGEWFALGASVIEGTLAGLGLQRMLSKGQDDKLGKIYFIATGAVFFVNKVFGTVRPFIFTQHYASTHPHSEETEMALVPIVGQNSLGLSLVVRY